MRGRILEFALPACSINPILIPQVSAHSLIQSTGAGRHLLYGACFPTISGHRVYSDYIGEPLCQVTEALHTA